jgi:hypothetical protein
VTCCFLSYHAKFSFLFFQAFLGWKDPPVTPLMKLFFFNLTNADEFLSGRERPRVKKVGPYVYHQEIHKVNIRNGEHGSASFTHGQANFWCGILTSTLPKQ